jgi:hypothetical protein
MNWHGASLLFLIISMYYPTLTHGIQLAMTSITFPKPWQVLGIKTKVVAS